MRIVNPLSAGPRARVRGTDEDPSGEPRGAADRGLRRVGRVGHALRVAPHGPRPDLPKSHGRPGVSTAAHPCRPPAPPPQCTQYNTRVSCLAAAGCGAGGQGGARPGAAQVAAHQHRAAGEARRLRVAQPSGERDLHRGGRLRRRQRQARPRPPHPGHLAVARQDPQHRARLHGTHLPKQRAAGTRKKGLECLHASRDTRHASRLCRSRAPFHPPLALSPSLPLPRSLALPPSPSRARR